MMLQRGRGKIRAPRRVLPVNPSPSSHGTPKTFDLTQLLSAARPPDLIEYLSPPTDFFTDMPSIKPLAKDGDVDFNTTWSVLATALHEIHTKNASQLSFEELYRNAYKIVLKKKGEMLYDRVSQFEEAWLRDQVRARITNLITPSINTGIVGPSGDGNERRIAGERFMKALKDAFEDHQLCMCMITDVLMYMDRTYCQDSRRPSIYATSMALFRIHVLQTPFAEGSSTDVLGVLETVILDMIAMERAGEVVDRALIRACCYMLEGLYTSFNEDENSKLYLISFEDKFIESSNGFYRSEGQTLLANADASTFCSQARRRLKEEEERCQQTISMLTEPKIKSVVDSQLISANIRDVINLEGTGVKNMLDNDRVEDLLNVYNLISRVDPKKTALRDAVQKRVVELGSDINRAASVVQEAGSKPPEKAPGDKSGLDKPINQQTAAAITWVEDILKLKAKYDRLWEEAFKKDVVMEQALEHSFQDFINANMRSPEHLSLFFDEHLKKSGKGKTEAEVDALLDKGIVLLQYITDKDLFETYYKKHMAKRLLMKRSIRDMERQMLSKMKMKIGNSFTQKLEGLLKDMNVSDDLNVQYKESVAKLGDPDLKRIDIEARVLTTTVWPFENLFRTDTEDGTPRMSCVYPPEVESIRKKFEGFYLGKHSGRQLTWLPGMGDADIRATFKGANGKTRRHELNVSTYSMVILLLFNDLAAGQSLTYEEIMAQTNIPKHELVRNLQSLALAPKTRVLRKEPMSKDVNPTDKFYFNDEFTSPFVRVKIGVVASTSNKVESNEERKETQKRADEERGVAIEAAIVRIMKQRKNLLHQQLMTETLQQLSSRFQPDVNMIKKKIEALIDREYLERGPNADQPSYNYLA